MRDNYGNINFLKVPKWLPFVLVLLLGTMIAGFIIIYIQQEKRFERQQNFLIEISDQLNATPLAPGPQASNEEKCRNRPVCRLG